MIGISIPYWPVSLPLCSRFLMLFTNLTVIGSDRRQLNPQTDVPSTLTHERLFGVRRKRILAGAFRDRGPQGDDR